MELDGTPLVDPEARAEAFRYAEELETLAFTLDPELTAETLVKAAEIYRGSLGDPVRAISLLRRALHADPRCMGAISRLKALAEERGDWPELSSVLDLAAKAVTNDEQRAQLVAQRGDVVGRKLGRIAEARGLYREAARISNVPSFRDIALKAASRLESILAEKKPLGQSAVVEWAPVSPAPVAIENIKKDTVPKDRTESDAAADVAQQFFRRAQALLEKNDREGARALIESGLQLDPDSELGRQLLRRQLRGQGKSKELAEALIALAKKSRYEAGRQTALLEAAQLAAGPLSDIERALDLYQQCLSTEPINEQALAEAVVRGVGQGILDVARRVLPHVSAARRADLLSGLTQAALVAGDERAAREFRAATFEERPTDAHCFEAAVEILRSRKNEVGLIHALEVRKRATSDALEKRAIAFELAGMYEAQGQPMEAAEALLDSIRLASGSDDVSDELKSIDRLADQAKDRTLATRAMGAAASREGIEPKMRARHLRELARILADDLGDLEAAKAAREEAEASLSATGEAAALRLRPEVIPSASLNDWAQAVPSAHSAFDTMVDRALAGAELENVAEEGDQMVQRGEGPTMRIATLASPVASGEITQPGEVDLHREKSGGELAKEALLKGALPRALDLLASSTAAADPSVTPGLWIRTADLALELGRKAEAQSCLQRALDLEPKVAEARRKLSRLSAEEGRFLEAAAILEPLLEDGAEPKAALLRDLGRLRLRAGDLDGAKAHLLEARALEPASIETALDLLAVLRERRDQEAIAMLAAEMEPKVGPRAAEWHTALGLAKKDAGDVAGARDAFLSALIGDRTDPVPAEGLFDLARSVGRSEWMDEALRELRARAVERQDASRAYLAAGVLVARRADHEEDRLTFESLRVAFRTRPRAPLARAWIAEWIAALPPAEAIAETRPEIGEAIPIEGALREALETAQRALGFERIAVHRLSAGKARYHVRLGQVPVLSVAPGVLENRFLKGLRFDLGRALSALLDPRLSAALSMSDEDAPASTAKEVELLDRAGLLLSGDAAIALETVGPRTARGEALAAFAVSREILARWAEIGLGIAKVGAED